MAKGRTRMGSEKERDNRCRSCRAGEVPEFIQLGVAEPQDPGQPTRQHCLSEVSDELASMETIPGCVDEIARRARRFCRGRCRKQCDIKDDLCDSLSRQKAFLVEPNFGLGLRF